MTGEDDGAVLAALLAEGADAREPLPGGAEYDSGRWHAVDACRPIEMRLRDAAITPATRLRAMEGAATSTAGPDTAFPAGALVPDAPGGQPLAWWEEAVVLVAFLLAPGSMVWQPLLFAAALLWLRSWTVVWVAVAWVAVANAVPAPRLDSVALSPFRSAFMRYFSYKLVWRWRLHPGRKYILAAPPHGAFPFGNLMTMLAMPDAAGFHFRGLAASAALRVPIVRHVFSAIGVVDASRANAARLLADGVSLGISPGGIAEIFHCNERDEVVFLARKGMAKLALQQGASLVPCYLLGNTRCMHVVSDSSGVLQWLSRRLAVSLVWVYGRFFLPLPFRVPIAGIMGEPMDLPVRPNPSQQEIDVVHQEYIRRLRQLFDFHKAAYGWPDKTLVVIEADSAARRRE